MNTAIDIFKADPIVSRELMAHYGNGYGKNLNVHTNVITKEVHFSVVDKISSTKLVFTDLTSAIDSYNKIQRN